MLKIYGINGRTQALVKFPLNNGKACLQCEFKHGRIGAGMRNRPATYPTADITEQNIIEDSPLFGTLISLYRVAGDDVPTSKETPSVPELEYISGVTSKEEAVAYLKTRGAKATNLKDDESIQKYMAKIGVAFPNLEF